MNDRLASPKLAGRHALLNTERIFRLIAAVCSTSGSISRSKPSVLLFLLLLASFVVQASASNVPFWQRPEGTTSYAGPGSFIQDLDFASQRMLDFTTTAVSHDKAAGLLGAFSILDCPPNGKTNLDEAIDASTAFISRMGDTKMSLQSKVCHHVGIGSTLAQICNYSNQTIDIIPAAAESAFTLMATQCASKKASGTIQTSSGLQYALFAKVGADKTNKRRSRSQLSKRCLASDEPAVTGCEDAVCTPAIELNGSGDCPNVGNDETDGCAYFCEATAARYYGVPTIYDDTRYCAGTDCYLEEGEAFTVEKSISVNFGLEGPGPLESVLSAGISFGIAISETSSLTQGFTFREGACGWWYKVPVMIRSCGTLGEYEPNFGGEGLMLYCLVDALFSQTTPGACSEIEATAINSDHPDVFVIPNWFNCGDRTALP